MDLANFKKVNKLVILDRVFVILGYLDDYVSKKLYKVALAICVALVVLTNFNCANTGEDIIFRAFFVMLYVYNGNKCSIWIDYS